MISLPILILSFFPLFLSIILLTSSSTPLISVYLSHPPSLSSSRSSSFLLPLLLASLPHSSYPFTFLPISLFSLLYFISLLTSASLSLPLLLPSFLPLSLSSSPSLLYPFFSIFFFLPSSSLSLLFFLPSSLFLSTSLLSFFSLHRQCDFQSHKPSLARDISIARAKNDEMKVRQLITQLNSLSQLPYDPLGTTQYVPFEKMKKLLY